MVNLPLAQALAGLATDQATTVRLSPRRPADGRRRSRGRPRRAPGYVCRSWQERNAAQVDAFERQNRITLVLVLFTTLVAAFGVANVLVQLVADKRRDIAILRAAGFSRHDIGMIFLHQGVLLGLLGGIAGWVVGAVLIRVVGGAAGRLRRGRGAAQRAPADGRAAVVLPACRWLVAMVVCALAAVQPARRAAALEPTAILRGEH